ncbi:MAG: sulfatase [Planctomycetota bacterium]
MRILYLDLDALNPSHLGCYGYHRNTSPNIDRVAREGIRFDNVYCSDAPCLPSRTAFYQSRFGIRTGVVGHGGTAADPKCEGVGRNFRSTYEEDSFPRQLQKLGYHTAMISPFGQRHAAHQFYAGFHEIHNTGECGQEPVDLVEPVLRRWVEANAKRDHWYLHLNFWDIHTNYRVPMDYGNPFKDDPVAEWFTDEVIREHQKRGGPHSAQDLGMYTDSDTAAYPRTPSRITDRASLKQWIDGYDVAIRYVDDAIGRLFDALREQGVFDDTAIIITADHGENQGDLGIYGEHATADQGTCRIPFVVKWPGVSGGRVDAGLHYHFDWAPTCLELMGQDAAALTPTVWDGRSFADALRAEAGASSDVASRSELVLSQCAHVCQRSVRFDQGSHRWLYLRTYHDGLHPFPRHMLFDLAADPHEQHNLADQHPGVVRDAAARLLDWHDRAMAAVARESGDAVDPMITVLREGGPFHARFDTISEAPTDLPAYLSRLEQTGRAEAAESLRRRYTDDAGRITLRQPRFLE